MNPFGGSGRPGFGRTFVGPDHGLGAAHPLEWVIFALVLSVLLLTVANLALAYAGRHSRGGRRSWRPSGFGGGGPRRSPPDPLGVLSIRYARGEIGRDEFLRATDDLRGAPPAEPPSGEDEEPTVEQPPGS